ncbi:DUF4249 family protein [Mariniflexile litorale]|uniref:DUF4249 family protein n=1 Tax=Mariniflexile litorale TaxID=3045158 RepID=A0AAU7EKF7_9FLAO|nr:DUF4249 family protein [Mariniflexile sp. KMM 9835]MDQ8211198.1 DUF4249 family protein [Mariniflexile sp. KMM 9835]
MKKFIFLLIILSSCIDNEIDASFSDQLTVEGAIMENRFAEIYLTNSLPFDGIIDSLEVAKSIETKAKVELSNGEVTEILTLKREDSKFPFLFYRSNIIKGELGKQYDLSITIRDKVFTSKTTLPEKLEVLEIDFLKSIKDGVNQPDHRDIKLTINNNVKSVRYFKVLIKNEKEAKFSFAKPFIFNTENFSTDTFPLIVTYVEIKKDGERENKLKVNEVIELQLIAITKEQFDFWKSIKGDESTFIGNSSFSNEIISNVSNGAFGYWSGENVVFKKFIIPQN